MNNEPTTIIPIQLTDVTLHPQSPMVILKLRVLADIVASLAEAGAEYVCVGIATCDKVGDGDPLLCMLRSNERARMTGALFAAQCKNVNEVFEHPVAAPPPVTQ